MQVNELAFRSEPYIRLLKRLVWQGIQSVFRIEITGLEHIPNGACLLIANHNSGALIESHSLIFALFERGIRTYGLNHPALFKIPFVGWHFRKIGAVTASHEVSREVLKSNSALLIFPGGNRQAFRPYSQRHDHTFVWASGWANIAEQSQVPVVPVKFIGTHAINPILFCSKWLSKILVLPWLLRVKYFPVSLAQLIFASIGFALMQHFDISSGATAIVTYLLFCLTPLIPVLPVKIKIKIYPPLSSNLKTSSDIQDEMANIMSKVDIPVGGREVYALNGVERFMLMHESKELAYNSHLVFDFTAEIDQTYFLWVTDLWVQALPHLRSLIETGFWRSQRYVFENAWYSASDIVTFAQAQTQQQVSELTDQFCQKKFNLAFEPAVRVLVLSELPNGGQTRVIFSCHHTLFDGAAQGAAFEEWARIYNGQGPSERFTNIETFRFRSLTKYFGLKESAKLILENLRVQPPRLKFDVANVITDRTTPSRKVKSKMMSIRGQSRLGEEFYPIVLRLIDQALVKQGDSVSPMIVYMPVGLRFVLKVRNSLQNIVVSHALFLKRTVFQDGTLESKIETRIKADVIRANAKFFFGCLTLCSLARERRLQRTFARLDAQGSPVTSTALLVKAPMPRGLVTPDTWFDLFISARGTLLRSLPIGFIYTGKPGFETLTLEYISGLVADETIDYIWRGLEREVKNREARDLELRQIEIDNSVI